MCLISLNVFNSFLKDFILSILNYFSMTIYTQLFLSFIIFNNTLLVQKFGAFQSHCSSGKICRLLRPACVCDQLQALACSSRRCCWDSKAPPTLGSDLLLGNCRLFSCGPELGCLALSSALFDLSLELCYAWEKMQLLCTQSPVQQRPWGSSSTCLWFAHRPPSALKGSGFSLSVKGTWPPPCCGRCLFPAFPAAFTVFLPGFLNFLRPYCWSLVFCYAKYWLH